MKKILRLIKTSFILIVVIAFVGCSYKKDDNTIKIGIIQLVEHDALDSARRGFIDGLALEGYIDGENIRIDYQNAQGDQSNCTTIADKLVNERNNLILAISTPAAQAVVNATKKIPILVTAVTDPQSAGLVASNDIPGANVTGTSDLAPVKKQIDLIARLVPKAKNIGILYCSNEANSAYQSDIAEKEIRAIGLNPIIYTVSQASEIQSVVQTMIHRVDAIYTPTDNMMASSMSTITSITIPASVPLVCGESNVVSKGAIGTYGMDYYELGKLTSSQAIKILRDGKSPSTMPIEYTQASKLLLNPEAAIKTGLLIPGDLLAEAYLGVNSN